MGKQRLTLFFWAPKSLQMVTAVMKLKDAYSLEGNVGDGQGGLACCGSWSRKESDMTERLN